MPDVTMTAGERQKFNEAHTVPGWLINKNSDAYVYEASRKVLEELIIMAKGELNREYGGSNPTTAEIGHAELQPWHLGGSNTWLGHVGTLGWVATPSTAIIAFGNVTIRPETWVGIVGFEELGADPKVEAIQITVGNQTMPVMDISAIRSAPGNRVILPFPIKIVPRSTLKVDVKFGRTGYHRFKPIGVAVTRGSNLQKKSYYTT